MKQKKTLPIGISDFEELISNDYYYIDKTLLIKEIIDSGAKATLIPRPRRFGKTLNLSTIKYFFEKTKESKKHLFKNLKISKFPEYMQHQGQYPVIYLTFKDLKDRDWTICYNKIKSLITQEFYKHDYLLNSDYLNDQENKNFKAILAETASQNIYEDALKDLSGYLHKFYKKKPIILIDEYDAPIHAGFMNKFYDNIISFLRNFLSGGLKDNSDVKFGVLTGILRVAKESIFSGLNNLKVSSLLSQPYSKQFGLTEPEIEEISQDFDLKDKIKNIKNWYNGYCFGKTTIYNPWSIISMIDNQSEIQPYWMNTSDNIIIKELIKNSPIDVKENIETLISGKTSRQPINENIVFAEIFTNTKTLWSFLLFSGYLTFENKHIESETIYADLKIPNVEVLYFYKNTISSWFQTQFTNYNYNLMLKSLVSGNIKDFKRIFNDFVIKSFSYFDVSGNEPEKFYHAFVLGMLVGLQQTHKIKSNRESGYGRYDVMIIPNDKKELGIVIEFKKAFTDEEPTLEKTALAALKQIEEKQYEQELKELGIKKIIKLAIVFDGKKSLVKEG